MKPLRTSDFSIQSFFYLPFAIGLIVVSCKGNGEDKNHSQNAQPFGSLAEIKSIDSLKMLSEKLKRTIEEKTKKIERLKGEMTHVEEKNYARSFSDQAYAIVKASFAYLKKYPSEQGFDRTNFLVEGNEVFIVRIKEGHGYIEYDDPITEVTLKGWVDLHELEPNKEEGN